MYKFKKVQEHSKPGWNEHVAQLHSQARETLLRWVEDGKIKSGPLFELKNKANARFKYALRFVKNNENTMRADSIASKLQNKSYNDFWKEIRYMNNSKSPSPTNIEGARHRR